ncbi:MAG: aspartate aminotransferase family protein, partial [Dietzia sp.]|nr:aspartate aminotransferase family protein [Dietzia sp.]
EELLTLTCGPTGSVVRLIPALVVTAEEVDAGVERFTRAVHRVCDGAA